MNKITKRLVEIRKAAKIIFIGDTHGDLLASRTIIRRYLKPGNILVFLGDYVDRGPSSRKNLDFLLEKKRRFPRQVHLLMGNHDGRNISPCFPDDFWQQLKESERESYASAVKSFPLALTCGGIIALHGALPDVKNLREINNIVLGSNEWEQICWGDFNETPEELLNAYYDSRPQFGKDWFLKLMRRFRKNILIRAHQPDCPQFMFNNRCLTIFTSSAYGRKRTIAIYNPQKETHTAQDLKILEI